MKNHNSATYYSLTGHVPPLDDIRLRDTQELYRGLRQHGRPAQTGRRRGRSLVRLVPTCNARW